MTTLYMRIVASIMYNTTQVHIAAMQTNIAMSNSFHAGRGSRIIIAHTYAAGRSHLCRALRQDHNYYPDSLSSSGASSISSLSASSYSAAIAASSSSVNSHSSLGSTGTWPSFK